MKYLSSLILLVFVGSLNAQTITIEEAKHPYYDIIEWKGMGALLLSKDPAEVSKQVNITLVGNKTTSIWDQKFTPKGEEYYFISSENARYVYFLNNLNLNNGKVSLSQLNSAGNVKATSVSIGNAVKKLGAYDYNKLELINVVVTDKALIHHFRYIDKKNKSIVEIATFITHHNFICYAVELGTIPFATLKDERFGNWEYVGFSDDRIFFAARDYQDKKRGWSVKEFSSKGKQKVGLHLNSPENLIPIENIGFGTTGSYYLEDKATIESGLLTFINAKFYLVGGQRKDAGAEITLYELVDNEWEELSNMHLNYFIEKKNLKLGIYPLNEGVAYHLNHNGYNKTSILYFEKNKEAPHNDFTKRTIFNPSSVFDRKNKEEFNVILPEGLLKFDTQQLGKKGSVKFELIKK
ncbi:MAG: hypothetical protein COA33_006970 [Fluviicola sp.]|nr:hypothetical protein [Fluviicola sp.]